MRRFYFHLRQRDGLVSDEEGSLHADFEAARVRAVASARDMIAADVQLGAVDLEQSILIEHEKDGWVGEVSFASVLRAAVPEGTAAARQLDFLQTGHAPAQTAPTMPLRNMARSAPPEGPPAR